MENTTNHEHNAHHDMHHKVHAHASKLESVLADFFKKFPHLPEGGRKFLVDVSPYVALVFGILGVLDLFFVGISYYLFGHFIARGSESLYIDFIAYWVCSYLLIMSYKGLLARSKQGWNYVFYSEIVVAISALISILTTIFTIGGGIIGAIVGAIVWAIIRFYILFEIREHYK
jgi:hypothetical protein